MDLPPAVVVGEPASDVLFGLFLARRSGSDAPAWLDRSDRTTGPSSAAARALDILSAELCPEPDLRGSPPVEVRELAYVSLLDQARNALCLDPVQRAAPRERQRA